MKTVKKYWKPVLVVSAFFIGNRVFNHINAWLGISIIMLTVAFIVYNIIKKVENEKKMEIMDDSICSICYDRYNDAEQSSRGKKKNIYGEFQNDTM